MCVSSIFVVNSFFLVQATHKTFSLHLRVVQNGWPVKKHPRKGRPSKRFLVCREGYLGCIEDANDVRSLHRKGFPISSILNVVQGASTNVFSRTLANAPDRSAMDPLCMSVYLKERTLDIECETTESASSLYKCLQKISNS